MENWLRTVRIKNCFTSAREQKIRKRNVISLERQNELRRIALEVLNGEVSRERK